MSFSELDENSFVSGFMFAMHVCNAAGIDASDTALIPNLKSVASGDLDTMSSPADIIAKMEREGWRMVGRRAVRNGDAPRLR